MVNKRKHSMDDYPSKIPLIAFSLGFISIVCALFIGYTAFQASVEDIEEQYRNFYLREAKMLVNAAEILSANDDKTILNEIQTIWGASTEKAADEYICIVDKDSHLILHTAHPETAGNFAGNNPIFREINTRETCLADLVKTQRDYVGDYISSSGQNQLAAFSTVHSKSWVIGVHRSKQELIRDIEEGIKLSKIGFYVICGLLMPLFWILIYLTFQVAERKQKNAERALRESEENYRVLVHSMVDWVWAIDINGVYTFSNSAIIQLLGYEPEEVINTVALALMHPDSRPHVEAAMLKAVEQEKGWTGLELKWLHKDGSTRFVESTSHPKFDANGNLIGFSGVDRDITARKQSEENLLKQSYFLIKAQEIGQIGTWELDLENNDLIWTDETYRIFGLPIGTKITYEIFLNRVHPDDREYVDTEWNATFSGKPYDIEHRLLINGQVKWVREKADLEFNEKNECIRGIGFAQDITKQKQAEDKLRDSEKKSRVWLESSPVCTKIVDLDFNLQYMSAAGIIGLNIDDITQFYGKPYPFDFYPESFRNLMTMNLEKVKETGEIIEQEGSVFDINGNELWFHSTLVPVNDDEGRIDYIIVVSADITRRKQAEEEKEKLAAQLHVFRKMETIGTLAGGIAHDFNNILFPIVGHTEMLLEDIPKDSPLRNSLDEIYTGALRARDLVKQILTFSRQDDDKPRPMKMQTVIKEALKLIRSTIPTTIEIKQDIRNDCGIIKADPTQIHQVVMNLTTNAYHAMEDSGGELKVGLKEIELDEHDVTSLDMKPGVYACLTVADTGVGMDKDLTAKIFDPFFTTRETGKGTGMGLSVVHGIVKNTGGSIHVYSKPGRGTEFHVYLPVMKSLSEQQETQPREPIPGGTERILLVDDEEAIAAMEKQMLERLGYSVVSRTISLEALEAFRADPDKFDMIITDMAMPNMSGEKLAAELIKIRPDIPILLCTGFSERILEEKAVPIGIKGFLMKPIVRKDLAKKIREVLDNRDG
jgi:PAS domain S-box-containing protein